MQNNPPAHKNKYKRGEIGSSETDVLSCVINIETHQKIEMITYLINEFEVIIKHAKMLFINKMNENIPKYNWITIGLLYISIWVIRKLKIKYQTIDIVKTRN